ncbi:peroxiredoxin [Chitinophaga skermanii]|uniref:Peroxiredoxin n=2 Tax=Chitinophaga skermanii TaxID=331697 RepID=A0A327QVI3_9BACT|nr:peroxiredoxin [Chitinophaga skermanii]
MALLLLGMAQTAIAQKVQIHSAIHKAGTKITIYRDWPKRTFVDTVFLQEGAASFEMKDSLPAVYSISMRAPFANATVFSNEGEVVIDILPGSSIQLKGGKQLQALKSFEAVVKPLEKNWQMWGNAYAKSQDLDEKLRAGEEGNKAAAKVMEARVKFCLQHAGDIAGAWSAYNYGNLWREEDINKLLPAFKKYPQAGATYDKLLAQQQVLQANKMVGQPAPNFSLTAIDGSTVSLHTLLESHEYVLIDFWASWCTPCRATNRKLAKIYDKIKQKGIVVVSISVDEKEEAWRKAVEADKIPWLQLRTNNAMKSEAVKDYKVATLPATFLIDKKGHIIRQHISEEQLLKL